LSCTIFTRILFVGKRTLDFPIAKGSGNNPAGSASRVPLVETIVDGVNCSRTKAQFINLVAAWVPAAFHIFPAIYFFLHFQNFFCNVTFRKQSPYLNHPFKAGKVDRQDSFRAVLLIDHDSRSFLHLLPVPVHLL